jgi:hypothetical protein
MSKPDPVPTHCKRETTETKPKVEANARRAVFDNTGQSKIVIIDIDCWIRESESLKADYIVIKPQVVDVVVELKGSNIRHAIKQILATSERWRRSSENKGMIGGLVIFTHSPESSASLANKKKTLLDKNRIHLEGD